MAYQVFRMGYYGTLVPNTALAKSSGRDLWQGGWWYMRDFVQPYWLVVPLACLALGVGVPFLVRAWRPGDRRGLVALGALPLVGLVDALYVMRVGGDYMHGRLLLPALFALVAPLAAVPVTRLGGVWTQRPAGADGASVPDGVTGDAAVDAPDAAVDPRDDAVGRAAGPPRRRSIVPVTVAVASGVVLVWAVVAGAELRRSGGGVIDGLFVSEAYDGHVSLHGRHAVTAEDQGWGPEAVRSVLDSGVAVHVPAPVPGAVPRDGGGRPVYASWGIGVVGYALGEDVYVLDMLGLADPLVSRFELERPGATGHEKPIPAAWLAARVSDGPGTRGLPRAPLMSAPLYDSPPGELDADAEAARRALDCGDLADLSRAVHDPMTPSRFLRNLVDAPALTGLRVPADPNEAVDRFCE